MSLRAWISRALAVGFVLLAAGWATAQEPVLECPYDFSGGDRLYRGFYIPEYPADALDRVELLFATTYADTYTISLTVRENTYDGPVLGIDTVELELNAAASAPPPGDDADVFLGGIPSTVGVFEFDAVSVTPGSTVTFALELVGGDGFVYYDVGPCGTDVPDCGDLCSGEIVQTNGTEPPLDTYRRESVGIRVFDATPQDVPALGTGAAGLLALLLLVASYRTVRR
jgi:hypothetical protein